MEHLNASTARANLYKLMNDAACHHKPVCIQGRQNSVVLVGKEDWTSIQETLYLLSVPGMRESLLEGKQADLSECSKTLGW